MKWYMKGSVAAIGLLLAMVAGPAVAAQPATALVDGVLTSSGGSPAADGDYDLTFAIYDAATAGTLAWSETAKVKLAGGRFQHALGSVTAIDAAKLAALGKQWLSVKVGADPELPRQPLHSTIFALYAGEAAKVSCDGCVGANQLANGSIAAAKIGFNYAGSSTKGGPAVELECTACVGVAEMKFDGDVDLAGNSIKAKNGTFSGDLVAATVTATSFAGDGSKLTGIKTPSGECKNAGEVVKGINSDGSLKCVAAMDPTALPKDGIDEISNGLVSNQFVDTIAGASGIAIPDNTGSDANATLTFPDIGIAQTFELSVDVANTDLSKVAMVVLPPDDKKTGWTLCDPCGKTDEKSYKVTFSKDNMPKSGDLTAWIGANPKGTWNLKVIDTGYCVPQAPGNAALCNTTNKTDGSIVSWNIKIQTLSNKKIKMGGDLYVDGKIWGKDNGHGVPGGPLVVGSSVKLGDDTATCDAGRAGALKYAGGYVSLCTPDGWVRISQPSNFPGSKLISADDAVTINSWVGNPSMKWKLCYRYSDNTKNASTFHNNCNFKGPTVVVAKLNTGRLVGGYASCPWHNNYNSYTYHCKGSFLFSLTNGHRYAKKDYYTGSSASFSHAYGIYNHGSYGPCFGGGHDFCFNSSNMASGYSNLGHDYECRKVVNGDNGYSGYGTAACRDDFTGAYNWSTTDFEVWYQETYQ